MVTLAYEDVLELLGYRPTQRRQLEILGYDYSSEGAARFRRERPDYLPQIVAIIADAVARCGSFPKDLSSEDLEFRDYLAEEPDGAVVIDKGEEIGFSRFGRVRERMPSVEVAAAELTRRRLDPQYLPLA